MELSEEERELIAQALETPEGRLMLAQAMAEPIRCGGWTYCNCGGHHNGNRPCNQCGRELDGLGVTHEQT
jgi:hypothetical protein